MFECQESLLKIATSAILNLEELLNRVDDDRELLVEIFGIFKTSYPGHLQRISEAIKSQDARRVETESHALKGMLLNLSAVRAASAAITLESMAREGRFDGGGGLLAALRSEIDLLLAHMDECASELRP
jgi:HPt (histidine-containing phosphotransfer) domain-containing protein